MAKSGNRTPKSQAKAKIKTTTYAQAKSGNGAQRRGRRAAAGTPFRRRLGRWLRRLSLVIVGALGAPYVLAALYVIAPPPITAVQIGRVLQGDNIARDWRPLARLDPNLARAVIAGEDNLFCEHHGVDWNAVELAVRDWRAGERARGASTLTMQLAKNLFLWQGRSKLRKLLELPLALWIDLVMSKRRQIEIYLNVAEMGPNVFGAEAGAQRAFGRSADRLSVRQAAALAAALPNPVLRDPAARGAAAAQSNARHAGRIASRMGRLGARYYACVET